MDTGFLAAVLVAAVLVYDRLGGNHEVSRRLFQVGLAVSLVFVVLSGAAAFIRADAADSGFTTSATAYSGIDAGNRLVTISAVQYGFGVAFLVAGLTMLRRYHTVPLGFIVGGVFLLLTGPAGSANSFAAIFTRSSLRTTQKFDVGVFTTAAVGTIVLLAYGMQLERDFARDTDAEGDEAAEATSESR